MHKNRIEWETHILKIDFAPVTDMTVNMLRADNDRPWKLAPYMSMQEARTYIHLDIPLLFGIMRNLATTARTNKGIGATV